MNFAVLANHRIKLKECEKKDKYNDLAKELKETLEHEGVNYTNRDWCLGTPSWKLEDEWRFSKQQHYLEQPEY